MLMQKEVENVFRDQGKAQAIKEILHTFERRLEN